MKELLPPFLMSKILNYYEIHGKQAAHLEAYCANHFERQNREPILCRTILRRMQLHRQRKRKQDSCRHQSLLDRNVERLVEWQSLSGNDNQRNL